MYTYVHVYLCMYVRMNVCMYVCICVRCIHIWRMVYGEASALLHIHVCTHAYMYTRVHVCMHACTYVCMFVCIYVCTFVFLYVCMYLQTKTGGKLMMRHDRSRGGNISAASSTITSWSRGILPWSPIPASPTLLYFSSIYYLMFPPSIGLSILPDVCY